MSTLEVDSIVAATSGADLNLDGAGSGVVNLATGAELNGTALTSTFQAASSNIPDVAPGTSGNLLTSNGSAWTSAAAAAGGAWTLIGTSVASASASLTVTGLDSTYDTYAIGVSALRPASNDVDLWLRLGDSSGIDSGGSDYGWAESTNGAARVSSSGDSKIKCTGDMGGAINGIGNAATEGVSGVFFLGQPADAGMYSTVYGNPSVARTTTPAVGIFMGQRQANIAHDRVQVLFQSGNITSGRLTVWGISHE